MGRLSIIGLLILVAFVALFINHGSGRLASAISNIGGVTTENRNVGDFTRLKLDGVFTTIISQDGGPVWVRVEANQTLQKAVEVKSNGETLEIKSKSTGNFNFPHSMTVYVNVKNINSIINTSVGKTQTAGRIKAQELYLGNDAVGKMTLDIDVQKLTAELNSVGATVLAGTATEASIDNNSVGKLDAYRLQTDKLKITNNSVGAVEVYAAKEIAIDHNGVGSLHYRGPAKVTSLKNNGVGKASKED